MNTSVIKDDWEVIMMFLPENWQAKAVALKALARKRKIDSPQTLLRLLLIYLADGKSLRSTAAYAKEAGLCNINDAALLHRLRAAGEWFRWMSVQILKDLQTLNPPPRLSKKFRIRLVDATCVSQPGSKGTNWRIHYSINFETLICNTFTVTDYKVAESFKLYPIEKNDLLIADRGYCSRRNINHVIDSDGQVLVRFHSTALPLFTRKGKRFNVLEHLRGIKAGKIGDFDVWFRHPENENLLIKGRLCAMRKSLEAMEIAKEKILKAARKKGHKVRPETLEYAEYVSLFTTVNRHNYSGKDILSLYRGRWQIELMFKRLKGIIGLGHLPDQETNSCISWLYGKMLVALLVERIYREADFISPWGYPLISP
jgi:hypothetical protein